MLFSFLFVLKDWISFLNLLLTNGRSRRCRLWWNYCFSFSRWRCCWSDSFCFCSSCSCSCGCGCGCFSGSFLILLGKCSYGSSCFSLSSLFGGSLGLWLFWSRSLFLSLLSFSSNFRLLFGGSGSCFSLFISTFGSSLCFSIIFCVLRLFRFNLCKWTTAFFMGLMLLFYFFFRLVNCIISIRIVFGNFLWFFLLLYFFSWRWLTALSKWTLLIISWTTSKESININDVFQKAPFCLILHI